MVIGTTRQLPDEECVALVVELTSTEVLKTSEIEGEVLDRVQTSLRRRFGLQADARRVGPTEQGIAGMLVSVYQSFAEPLSNEVLCHWHQDPMQGRDDLREVGADRSHGESMQVISGPVHVPRVHFEAPTSRAVPQEMGRY